MKRYAAELDKRRIDRRQLPDINNVNRVKEDMRSINASIVTEEYSLLNSRIELLDEKKREYLINMFSGAILTIILLALINA